MTDTRYQTRLCENSLDIGMARMLNLAQAKIESEIEEHFCSRCRVRTKLIQS
jgi:hypothetical protein